MQVTIIYHTHKCFCTELAVYLLSRFWLLHSECLLFTVMWFCSALIKLLYETAESSTPSHRFTELVMKCLWKVVKMLPSWEAETDFDMVLYDIHLFLKVCVLSSMVTPSVYQMLICLRYQAGLLRWLCMWLVYTCAVFESQPQHWLSWLLFLVVFVHLSRQRPGESLN